ncbi:uncharacterized protein TNCV_5007281 [Trichonephila clavipes]|nr:uncharacterized protein TNCV_5007281 [Trichonephila clavipes]
MAIRKILNVVLGFSNSQCDPCVQNGYPLSAACSYRTRLKGRRCATSVSSDVILYCSVKRKRNTGCRTGISGHSKSRLSVIAGGCGSLVVKVSDHARHVMSLSPVPLKTRRVGKLCKLNLSRAQTSSHGIGWQLGEEVPAQVPSTSLDYGSKLRGSSPKALV